VIPGVPSADYDARLRAILLARDWRALREFSRAENQIPDDVYEKDQHFWEVLMHKIICSRLDLLAQHESSRQWLAGHGYSTDIAGY
jgi:hypothetical protein